MYSQILYLSIAKYELPYGNAEFLPVYGKCTILITIYDAPQIYSETYLEKAFKT